MFEFKYHPRLIGPTRRKPGIYWHKPDCIRAPPDHENRPSYYPKTVFMFNCRIRSKNMEKGHFLINQRGKNTMVITGKSMRTIKNSSYKSTICMIQVNKRSTNDQRRKFAVFWTPFVSNL